MAQLSREERVYLAKLAEQAERFDDMCSEMKQVAQMGSKLTKEERNLLSVAYKNTIGTHRSSWRTMVAVEQKMVSKNDKDSARKLELTKEFRGKVEDDLRKVCIDVQQLLEQHVIPNTDEPEEKVFFWKMMGDYYRYRAEFAESSERDEAADKSEEAYEEAMKVTGSKLAAPTRMGLILNYSVFLFEIRNNTEKACELARSGYDEVSKYVGDSQSEADSEYKDSALIMQLLQDNLALWASEQQEDED